MLKNSRNIFPAIPFEYIYGNSDFMIGEIPAEKNLEFFCKKIFLTHGHRYSLNWGYVSTLHKSSRNECRHTSFRTYSFCRIVTL